MGDRSGAPGVVAFFGKKSGLALVTVLQKEQIGKNGQWHWKEGPKLPLKRVFQTPESTFHST